MQPPTNPALLSGGGPCDLLQELAGEQGDLEVRSNARVLYNMLITEAERSLVSSIFRTEEYLNRLLVTSARRLPSRAAVAGVLRFLTSSQGIESSPTWFKKGFLFGSSGELGGDTLSSAMANSAYRLLPGGAMSRLTGIRLQVDKWVGSLGQA